MNNIGTSESAEPKNRPRNEPNANFAVVWRGPISKTPEIMDFIRNIPGARIIYQESAIGRLTIVREKEPEEIE